MEFTGIDHVVFRVQDPERTVAWWRETFGVEAERLDEWRRGDVLFVSVRLTPTTILDLFTGERPADQVDNVDHVAFVVEGVDLDELAASGAIQVESGPHDLWGGPGHGSRPVPARPRRQPPRAPNLLIARRCSVLSEIRTDERASPRQNPWGIGHGSGTGSGGGLASGHGLPP